MFVKYPLGPRNRKSDLEPNWYQNVSIFLTSVGTPVQRVNLEDFSLICGVAVVPGDMRKKFTTELANHSNQVWYLIEHLYHDIDMIARGKYVWQNN